MYLNLKILVVGFIIITILGMMLTGTEKSDYLGKYIGYGHPTLKFTLFLIMFIISMIFGFYLNDNSKFITI